MKPRFLPLLSPAFLTPRTHVLPVCLLPQMLPIVNLEGRRKVEAGDFCLRTKLNNVDLNRNYPVGFQKKVP